MRRRAARVLRFGSLQKSRRVLDELLTGSLGVRLTRFLQDLRRLLRRLLGGGGVCLGRRRRESEIRRPHVEQVLAGLVSQELHAPALLGRVKREAEATLAVQVGVRKTAELNEVPRLKLHDPRAATGR
eukprot:3448032-Prymnesium_polylepis.1